MESVKSTAIVVGILALLIGGGIGYAAGNSSKDMDDNNTSMSQSETKMADDGVTVGGAKMVSSKDIVDNAVNASNVSTTVDLVKQAGLVDTLKSAGPFTVFAPNNAAFDAVPKDLLSKVSGNNDLLKTVLTYHVVPGTYTSADLRAMANSGETLKTVQGAVLSFKIVDNKVTINDVAGQSIEIETADIVSSNGVTHVIKSVMLPVDPATIM